MIKANAKMHDTLVKMNCDSKRERQKKGTALYKAALLVNRSK